MDRFRILATATDDRIHVAHVETCYSEAMDVVYRVSRECYHYTALMEQQKGPGKWFSRKIETELRELYAHMEQMTEAMALRRTSLRSGDASEGLTDAVIYEEGLESQLGPQPDGGDDGSDSAVRRD